MFETSEDNMKMLHHMGMGHARIPILNSKVSILSFMKLMKQAIGKQ